MISQAEQAAFDATVNQWSAAGHALAEAERKYAEAYGEALAKAEGSTEGKRAAHAAALSAPVAETRDRARINEQAARYRVAFLIAAVGRRQPPV
jgi:hypothetical protein